MTDASGRKQEGRRKGNGLVSVCARLPLAYQRDSSWARHPDERYHPSAAPILVHPSFCGSTGWLGQSTVHAYGTSFLLRNVWEVLFGWICERGGMDCCEVLWVTKRLSMNSHLAKGQENSSKGWEVVDGWWRKKKKVMLGALQQCPTATLEWMSSINDPCRNNLAIECVLSKVDTF